MLTQKKLLEPKYPVTYEWFKSNKYPYGVAPYYFQCAYIDAKDTHWTLHSFIYDLLSKYSRNDGSYLRKYYNSLDVAIKDLHRALDKAVKLGLISHEKYRIKFIKQTIAKEIKNICCFWCNETTRVFEVGDILELDDIAYGEKVKAKGGAFTLCNLYKNDDGSLHRIMDVPSNSFEILNDY